MISARIPPRPAVLILPWLAVCDPPCGLWDPPATGRPYSAAASRVRYPRGLWDPPAAGRPCLAATGRVRSPRGRLSLLRRGRLRTFFPCGRPRTIQPPRPAVLVLPRPPLLRGRSRAISARIPPAADSPHSVAAVPQPRPLGSPPRPAVFVSPRLGVYDSPRGWPFLLRRGRPRIFSPSGRLLPSLLRRGEAGKKAPRTASATGRAETTDARGGRERLRRCPTAPAAAHATQRG